jgi:hypothetical protein
LATLLLCRNIPRKAKADRSDFTTFGKNDRTCSRSINTSMLKNKIKIWATTIVAVMGWNIISPFIFFWISGILYRVGLSPLIVEPILIMLPVVLFLEVFIKLLLIPSLPHLKFIPARPESFRNLNKNRLDVYTAELEALGFVHLTDYTIPSLQGMARLFAHPQEYCFAEIGQVNSLPMFCSISCQLENQWILATTNSRFSATGYAFLRQPRNLVKQVNSDSTDVLLQSLLEWRDQVSTDLNLGIIQDVEEKTYFDIQTRNRSNQRSSFLTSSITVKLVEMLKFSLHPKSEWLGDYTMLKLRL